MLRQQSSNHGVKRDYTSPRSIHRIGQVHNRDLDSQTITLERQNPISGTIGLRGSQSKTPKLEHI
jgi:hypothetical protein